jgi:hypothetical protein
MNLIAVCFIRMLIHVINAAMDIIYAIICRRDFVHF